MLLIDDDARLLLFSAVNSAGKEFWFPPGGGINPGETAEAAAVREVREETGLTDFVLGPEVGFRRHVFEWRGATYDNRERWFMARVRPFAIDTSGFNRGRTARRPESTIVDQ